MPGYEETGGICVSAHGRKSSAARATKPNGACAGDRRARKTELAGAFKSLFLAPHGRRGKLSRSVAGRCAGATAAGILALALAGGLAADSRAPAQGGFLYSQYLKNGPVADSAVAGSFVIRSRTQFFAPAADRVAETAARRAAQIPLERWALDSAFAEGSPAAAERLRAQFAEIGWDIAGAAGDELLLAATRDARARGTLRDIGIDVYSELAGRRANLGIYAIGAFAEQSNAAAGWQVRGFRDQEGISGGNFGVLYRRAVPGRDMLAGFNAFVDHYAHDVGDFNRWSAGGELRSGWIDLFGNYYSAITDDRRQDAASGEALAYYTADGYDLEVNLHSPSRQWLALVGGYSLWKGEFGQEDITAFRGGIKVAPPGYPLEWEFEYSEAESGERSGGGRIALHHEFGHGAGARAAASDEFRPSDWFFAPADREYYQRIRNAPAAGGIAGTSESIWTLESLGQAGSAAVLIDVSRSDGVTVRIVNAGNGRLDVQGAGFPASISLPWRIAMRGEFRMEMSQGAAVLSYSSGESAGMVAMTGSARFAHNDIRVRMARGESGAVFSAPGGSNQGAPGLAVEAIDPAIGQESITLATGAQFSVSHSGLASSSGARAVTALLGADFAASGADCDPASYGIFDVYCDIDAYFASPGAGERLSRIVNFSARFAHEAPIATLVAQGGRTPDQLSFITPTSGLPSNISFDAETGELALASDAPPGSYSITVQVEDGDDSRNLTNNPAVALIVRVTGVSFPPIIAGLAGGALGGGTVSATGNVSAETVIGTLELQGGSGQYSVNVVTGGLIGDSTDNRHLRYDPAARRIFMPPTDPLAQTDGFPLGVDHETGATLSIVLEITDTDSRNSGANGSARFTLFAILAAQTGAGAAGPTQASFVVRSADGGILSANPFSPLVLAAGPASVLAATVEMLPASCAEACVISSLAGSSPELTLRENGPGQAVFF